MKDFLFTTASGDKWQKIGTSKRGGVLVPLFSVYSKNSLGIGDLSDLKLLIEWAAATHNSILQLLPMNETGCTFCPYDSVSSFALEPSYLCLEDIPALKTNSKKSEIENLKKLFPCGKAHVDYEIKNVKLRFLGEVFAGESGYDPADLGQFKKDNSYWLDDFALYKALKSHHSGRVWWDWEDKYKNRDACALEHFQNEHKKEIAFAVWLQWLVYEQFSAVKKFAASKKVLLKGDLPILVSRDSADVWARREFFKLDFAAGAPPDMYCSKGQRWGMPTYNWERIASDGYHYLKERLKFAQNFYDILRIDHVVGLFRIWSIPYNDPPENEGLHGFFDPHDESRWAEHGKNILSVIVKNTNMLLCAEDLGIIPAACPKTLRELGIPGNDVQRWTKDWHTRHDFLKPAEYRGLSAAMLSTHDTTNWAAWWENEAGTVDEQLFMRKCKERGINYAQVKDVLFDAGRSFHGRLRWREKIKSADILAHILGKRKEELKDFIDMYENTYLEKEKLWKQLKLRGRMREKSDARIVRAALRVTLDSASIFCINTLIDWLYLADIYKGDPYRYRINTPGTVSPKNWSLTIPLPLEELLKHKINKEIRKMITASGRI